MNIYMNSKHDNYKAFGTFNDGKETVLKGSRIYLQYQKNFRHNTSVVNYRNDPSYVNINGLVLKDCEFKNPSSAAQFVNGRSTNGYIAWRIDEKINLRKWLEQTSQEK